MKEDKSMLVFMHLSGLLLGFWGPLIFWIAQKETIIGMDEHGKDALNFQLSMIIYVLLAIMLSFFCIGFILIPAIVIIGTVFPIISAVNANKDLKASYPLSIRFIQ